jgi:phosphoribosylformimino-5-aminoimidazole carboxamide ribotide isomerase
MILYPALDLMGGACVRLSQGSFTSKKVYDEDPARVLAKFQENGAKFVHVVDLDGAKDPQKRQIGLLEKLARFPVKIQAGGGIRATEDVQGLLSAGVDRVVVGTLAAKQPDIFSQMLLQFTGDRLTVALDLFVDRNGDVAIATSGWREKSNLRLEDLMEWFLPLGLKRVLCTDISKDGMLAGPNFELYRRFIAAYPNIELQASGGVRSIEDLLALKQIPVHSAVVGKAIYENNINLAEALRQC